jgi:hypothetical protein
MRRLSAFLEIPVDDEKWPKLVRAATFESMKERADDVAPGAHHGEWKKPSDFFRMARMGQWQDVLTPENQELYEQVTRERIEPELKTWLECGRG